MYAKSPVPGTLFFCVAITFIGILNVLPATEGSYHPVHFILGMTQIICFTPMTLYLFKPVERLPFFQLLCIVYSVHYTWFPFFGARPYILFDHLDLDNLLKPSLLIFGGMLTMVIGYYWRPINLILRFIPPMQLEWEPKSAKKICIVFMGIGFFGTLGMKTGLGSGGAGQIINFLANFSIVGILGFYILRIRREISLSAALMVWFLYVPAYMGLAISGGNSGPIGTFSLAVILTYVGERKKIPWMVIILCIMALFPFMYAKFEYRDQVWGSHGEVAQEGLGDAAENTAKFGKIAASTFTADPKIVKFALHAIAIRFDITFIFAYIVDQAPRRVEYLNGESYSDILYKLIPRLLWPDKPNPSYGQLFGHMFQFLAPDDTSTSINFPQLVETYVNFGIPGVLIGMFLMSQIYWTLCYFMNSRKVGDWIAVFSVSIFAGLFRVESNFSLVVAGIFYHIVLYYVVGFFIRTMAKREARPPRRRAIRF